MMNVFSFLLFAINMVIINAQNAAMSCYSDQHWVNDWDGGFGDIKLDNLYNGIYSIHDNGKEDRRFKFRYCKPLSTPMGPFTGAKTTKLRVTEYDEEWYRGCASINGGNAAIHGIDSWHDNDKEDRQFEFYCGSLDVTQSQLRNCHFTGILNDYDGILDYNCPNNGVIRSIWSRHDSHHEDRQFEFECCNLIDITYSFENITGVWEEKVGCTGCTSTEFTKQFGTSSSITETIQETYSNELSQTVSAGFDFGFGGSASVEISGTQSQQIANSMSSAFSESYSESTTLLCENTYLYQWIIKGIEQRVDGTEGVFFVYSNDYLCTNSYDPQCPAGYCADSDCQTCIDPDSDTLNHFNL